MTRSGAFGHNDDCALRSEVHPEIKMITPGAEIDTLMPLSTFLPQPIYVPHSPRTSVTRKRNQRPPLRTLNDPP